MSVDDECNSAQLNKNAAKKNDLRAYPVPCVISERHRFMQGGAGLGVRT